MKEVSEMLMGKCEGIRMVFFWWGGEKILRCLKIMELNWWKRVSPHDQSLWSLKSLGVEAGEAS